VDEAAYPAYPSLGVPAFGRLLRTTPLRYLNIDVYRRTERGDFETPARELEAAEVSHLLSAILVVSYMIQLIALGDWPPLSGYRWRR
jgi:hypothetical protein